MQRNHYNTNFSKKQFPVVVICDNISNASNIGSLLRTADTFGIEKLIFCGEGIAMSRKAIKTSRATEKVVPFEMNADIQIEINKYKKDKYKIIALEITTKSIPLTNYCFSSDMPLVIIIGDENFGVSEAVLSLCDQTLHIDMFGQNSSMNVVHATSIALYEITKQLNGKYIR